MHLDKIGTRLNSSNMKKNAKLLLRAAALSAIWAVCKRISNLT